MNTLFKYVVIVMMGIILSEYCYAQNKDRYQIKNIKWKNPINNDKDKYVCYKELCFDVYKNGKKLPKSDLFTGFVVTIQLKKWYGWVDYTGETSYFATFSFPIGNNPKI